MHWQKWIQLGMPWLKSYFWNDFFDFYRFIEVWTGICSNACAYVLKRGLRLKSRGSCDLITRDQRAKPTETRAMPTINIHVNDQCRQSIRICDVDFYIFFRWQYTELFLSEDSRPGKYPKSDNLTPLERPNNDHITWSLRCKICRISTSTWNWIDYFLEQREVTVELYFTVKYLNWHNQ